MVLITKINGKDERIDMLKPMGLTKDAGWVVGARRTFSISPGKAWELILSSEAIRIWLGEVPYFKPALGASYQLPNGTQGEVTTFIPGSHLRLTWQPVGYPRLSIIQVRVIPAGEKTTISFHQEHLPDAAARALRKVHFSRVLEKLSILNQETPDK